MAFDFAAVPAPLPSSISPLLVYQIESDHRPESRLAREKVASTSDSRILFHRHDWAHIHSLSRLPPISSPTNCPSTTSRNSIVISHPCSSFFTNGASDFVAVPDSSSAVINPFVLTQNQHQQHHFVAGLCSSPIQQQSSAAYCHSDFVADLVASSLSSSCFFFQNQHPP